MRLFCAIFHLRKVRKPKSNRIFSKNKSSFWTNGTQLCQQEIRGNFHHFSPTRHEGAQGLKGSNFVMLLSSFSSSFSKEKKKFHSFSSNNEHLSKYVRWFFFRKHTLLMLVYFTTKTLLHEATIYHWKTKGFILWLR